MLSHPPHSWETVPADVRAVTAKALEDFSEDDAFYAYINIDRSKNAETVNELTSPIRNPLYPIQRELGTALCYLLDIAANDEVLSSRCITRVLNKFERQLQDVLECFGTSEQALYPWSIPESGADGKALWFDTLLEDSPSDTGEPKDVKPRVLNHMAQLLQMIFGRYLRPECMLRLIESVRKDPGTGYMQSEEYKLYDSYCQLIQHCRGLLILFFKEYLKKGYVIKKSYNKISSLFYRVKDYISNFESPDSQTIEQFSRFSEEAKAIYSAEQLTYACKKFNNDTLFLKSWTKQIMDQQTYSKMFGLKQKLEMTYPFVILQCAEEDMHRVYDLLWLRIFRLDDAAEKNQSHLNYEKEKKIYDEDVRERQNKLRGDYSTKRPPAIKAPDSTVMARDYRYQIPDAEFEFLTCIFKIAFTKPKRRLPLTANLLSENDRKDILKALQKLRDNVNIHFYINVKQNCKADITACKKDIKKDSVDLEPDIIIDICQIAEYKLLYPQANQIYDIICRICNHFTQDGLFSKNTDKELLLRTYPLITEAVKYIHEKMNLPSAAAQPEAKENTTDRMKNALDEWCAGLSKKEKMMYLPADPIDHGDCQ